MKRYSERRGGISPWAWIPTLYIAEGLPYFAVNTVTVLMYFKLGIGKAEIAFFTGWLYLPWVIKPFWSPFVDIIRTKRWWTRTMQLCMAVTMAAVAFLLPTSFFFAATLAVFWLMAFFSATHDIAADGYYMLELSSHDQAAYVGVRSTFYRIASVIGQGGLVYLAGMVEKYSGDIRWSWMLVFIVLSAFFFLVYLYHGRFMPVADADKPRTDTSAGGILRNFMMTFVTFFRKPHIVSALCFMLLYRLPEAICLKMVQPFLVEPRTLGGLGLETTEVGVINGVVGVVGLLAGGILGGLAIARHGLRRWLWPMAMALTLPCFLYLVLAMLQPQQLWWIGLAFFVEQFGYGFGFTAFMLYLIYFSQGESKTSHYAFCTAFMALGMMVPGMAAGWIWERLALFNPLAMDGALGYVNFFAFVMVTCVVTFASCAFLHIDPNFGKK